jgi:hypothetical protein
MCLSADDQVIRINLHLVATKLFYFTEQDSGVDHHPISYTARFIRVKYARGDQMEDKLLILHHQGVTGVITSLKSDNKVCRFTQEIYNFAFALITPLGSYHNYAGHGKNL